MLVASSMLAWSTSAGPRLQPEVMAPVDLGEHPFLGHAVAAGAVARGTSSARADDPGRGEDTVHGGAGECEPFMLDEPLGEVLEVDVDVRGAGEVEEALAHRGGGAPGRGGPGCRGPARRPPGIDRRLVPVGSGGKIGPGGARPPPSDGFPAAGRSGYQALLFP